MKENTQGIDSQPSSVTELEPLVKEFISELKRIDSEIEILTIDRKELFEKYAEKIDVKTLKQAIRVQAIRDKVSRKDTFNTFVHILEGDL